MSINKFNNQSEANTVLYYKKFTCVLWRSVVSIMTEYANTYAASALANIELLKIINETKLIASLGYLFSFDM